MVSLNPYVAAGKFKPFDGATELVPGVSSVPAYGHTKGHTVYMVESKGQKMVMLGDLMHVASVQFPNPSVTIQFDTDPRMAATARRKLYAESARDGVWLAVAHLPFPGIGHIRAEGAGYLYVPANYTVSTLSTALRNMHDMPGEVVRLAVAGKRGDGGRGTGRRREARDRARQGGRADVGSACISEARRPKSKPPLPRCLRRASSLCGDPRSWASRATT
jgi:glyoxylase-like metal-dependent hydrolase (beta-lactamase superfamily II)